MKPSLADQLYDRAALLSRSGEVIASLRLTHEDKSKMRGACKHLADALDRCVGITLQQRWHDFEKTVWPRWASNIDRPCTLWTWGARVLVPARIVVPSMDVALRFARQPVGRALSRRRCSRAATSAVAGCDSSHSMGFAALPASRRIERTAPVAGSRLYEAQRDSG
jgi:hypothetical protein